MLKHVLNKVRDKMWWILLVFSLGVQHSASQLQYTETKEVSYEIVGIFSEADVIQRNAFNESAQHASVNDRRWQPIILKPAKPDSYSVWRELCKDNRTRPLVVVGPQTPISDGAVLDQCMKANIPHIQASWQPYNLDLELNEIPPEEEEPPQELRLNVDEDGNENAEEETAVGEDSEPVFKKISINFYPDSEDISKAHAALLKYYQWESFAVLYEDDFGLLRIQKILADVTTKYPITVRQLDPEGDNHSVFKELRKYQVSRILLDCHVDRIRGYLQIADNLHMVNHYQHYIFVSLDASVLADEMTRYHSNITWLTLTDMNQLKDAQHQLAPRVGAWTSGGSPPVTDFKLEALLMDDMANHVLKAVRSLEQNEGIERIVKPRHHICEKDSEPWALGAKLQNEILNTETMGVTGKILFDDLGRRVNYTLYVNEISMSERNIIGRWESTDSETIVDDRNMTALLNSMTRKHFIVISRKAKPYFYDKEPCEGEDCPENEEKYEGFSVDLVKAIFEELNKHNNNFTYEFQYDEDNKKTYGHYDPLTKKWDGLIGDLLDKKADLAVCDLSITEERKKVVDFSVPFMSLGISILYTKEHKVPPETFSFLNPYSFEVWMYTATAYCVVSIVLFICARISPADWENPQPCDKEPEELENIWNFKNCSWLTMGSIMTQGCDILPKAVGTRWVCGMWWFFAVIVCQTYIAQLSASMTSAMEDSPINSVEDLARQNKILYGALNGGSTLDFFRRSKDKTYQKIYETMMANPVVLVDSNDEGEKRVLNAKNKFAFFMESTTIEYKMKRDCELKKVGGELDAKDYGIAMPANSPFRHQINSAILELNQHSKLREIKDQWWGERYGAKECQDLNKDNMEGDMEMENLIGVFLVLLGGLVLSVFITAAEFFDEVRNIVVREEVSHKEAFVKELKASLNFFQLQKPVLRNPSRAPSLTSEDQQNILINRSAAIENFMDLEKQRQ